MRVANVTPSAQVIDEVYVSAYSKKRSLKLYALIALVIGMGIPAAIIFFLDRIRRTVDSAKEVKLLTSLPMLASVSAEEVDDKASPWARPVQANLGFMLGASGGNTVMVTSMGQGENRERVAAALAREFARQGEKTLLLQADLSHEGTRPFGINSRAGVAEYISGKATMGDITCKVASEPGLSVITAAADGVVVAQSMTIIASPRFKELLKELKADYKVVVIDAPAVGETGSETAVLAAESDVTVLATRKGITLISDLERLPAVNASGLYRQLSVIYTEA